MRSGATMALGCRSKVRTSAMASVLAGVRDGLPDDLLVAEMHAVKYADGQADFFSARLQFMLQRG